MEVHKFGGGIMNGAPAIKHLPKVFEQHIKGESINVFSAFGKTTNGLEKAVLAFINGDKLESAKTLDEVKAFHLAIAHELFEDSHVIFGMIEDIFKKIEKTLADIGERGDSKFVFDQVVPYGEILASLIVSNYFSTIGVPNKLVHAIDFVKTDANFGEANVDKIATYEKLKEQITAQLLATHKNIITQGFIGSSDQGMTTLGREGSDYTAGLIGNLTGAEKVVLWKNVPGVMDGDPNKPGNENAKIIDSISREDFKKSLETTAKGLVHPKTLDEVEGEIQVRPFDDLDAKGTIIGRKT